MESAIFILHLIANENDFGLYSFRWAPLSD